MREFARFIIEKALAILLGLFLLLTLFRGGNTELAMKVGLIGALLLITLAALYLLLGGPSRSIPGNAPMALLAALMLLLLAGLIGLYPLSHTAWLELPGRAFYSPVLKLLDLPDIGVGQLPFTLDVPGTQRALIALCPCIAIALTTQLLSRSSLLALLGALSILAVVEAAIGFVQLGYRGAASMFVLDYAGHARASGTFVNKNHYATLLAMALPVMIIRAAGHCSFFLHGNRANTLANFWWGIAAAFVGAALVASLSRAGVFAGAFAAASAVALCLHRRREGVSRKDVALGVVVLVLFAGLAAAAGLSTLLKSVTSGALLDGVSSRSLMNTQTWLGVVAFFPLGAGLGSYSIAFPRFQERDLTGYIEYAHNDYLQLLFETGFIGIVVLVLIAIAAFMTSKTLWRSIRDEERLPAGIACLLGATAFAVHAWFDFPAHIPAIACIATLLFSAAMNPQLNIVGRKRRIAEHFDGPMLREATPYPLAEPLVVGEPLPPRVEPGAASRLAP